MISEIKGFCIDSYQNGMRQIMYAAEPGVTKITTKEGSIELPFAAGDIMLADEHGRVILGPVSIEGAVDLAERILEGDHRAMTDPLALLTLATAVAGFRIEVDPDEPEPVATAAAALATTGA